MLIWLPGAHGAEDGAEVAPGSSQLGPALMWRLRQWTDELCNGDGYNALMKVWGWMVALWVNQQKSATESKVSRPTGCAAETATQP
eukprot:1158343-Pelagomonas_calceolata.AAC.3